MRDKPLTPNESNQHFEGLLAYALAGNIPPSDTGFSGDVEEILIQVAVGKASEASARAVYKNSI